MPSPVKFHKEDSQEELESEADEVSNIIESLETSQDEYAVYVTDDELARVARETVDELQELDQKQSNKQNLDLEINEILSKISPPTVEEVQEKRQNQGLQLELIDDDDEDDQEVNEKTKYFAVFDKAASAKALNSLEQDASKTKNKAKLLGRVAEDQMIIDAGQKDWTDITTCVQCSFVFNPRNAEDEEQHQVHHSLALQGVKFQGWKNERVLGEFPMDDARIIVVKPNDHQSHWSKVREVLQVVDKQLGINSEDSDQDNVIRNKDETQVYLFIGKGKVVGLLLGELLHESKDQISRAVQDQAGQWVLRVWPKRVNVGISRIWVAQDWRRKSVATRLGNFRH